MREPTSYNADVAAYYRRSAWLYRYMWYSKRSLSFHYGFWEQNTQSHDEALLNQFREVVRVGKIKPGMRVLDAGCGVGGGAIYVAREAGAHIVGITITPEQVQEARDNAKRVGVEKHAQFLLADYTKMPFPDNSFDVVFAVESACHAYPKHLFLDEAYRVLKPGGVLLVSDGYTKRAPVNAYERQLVSLFCAGWRLKELIQFGKMTEAIKRAKFTYIQVTDKTKAVQPSLDRMKLLELIAKPLVWLSYYLPLPVLTIIRDNTQSMRTSREGVEIGLMGYYVHSAQK